jgi:hypothetical protein
MTLLRRDSLADSSTMIESKIISFALLVVTAMDPVCLHIHSSSHIEKLDEKFKELRDNDDELEIWVCFLLHQANSTPTQS